VRCVEVHVVRTNVARRMTLPFADSDDLTDDDGVADSGHGAVREPIAHIR